MPAPADTTSAVAHAEAGESDYYFDSYSHYGIHMEMLKDYHRTTSYRDAIMRNQYLFKDKVVLDVGCGTSILSMFAAKAGAKKVIGVDCSSVAKQAAEIVALNDFGPKPEGSSDTGACEIVILKGKVEELDLPKLAGVTHVDIIISEWMGYFLLYESMLNTVLYARDKWGVREKRLKPGRPAGSTDEADYEEVSAVKLFPDHANMCISAINDPQYVEEKFEVWNDVHGLDFSYFKRLSYFEPLVDTVARNQLRTDIVPLFSFALNTVTEAELSFESEVTLKCHTSDTIHALAVHFDTPFCAGHDTVVLNTSPLMPPTHWRQTVLYLHAPLIVMAGEKIKVGLSCKPNAGNPRDLDIAVKVHFDGKMQLASFAQDFRLR